MKLELRHALLSADGSGRKWVLCLGKLWDAFWSSKAMGTTFCCRHKGTGVHGLVSWLLYKSVCCRAMYSSCPELQQSHIVVGMKNRERDIQDIPSKKTTYIMHILRSAQYSNLLHQNWLHPMVLLLENQRYSEPQTHSWTLELDHQLV